MFRWLSERRTLLPKIKKTFGTEPKVSLRTLAGNTRLYSQYVDIAGLTTPLCLDNTLAEHANAVNLKIESDLTNAGFLGQRPRTH